MTSIAAADLEVRHLKIVGITLVQSYHKDKDQNNHSWRPEPEWMAF